jgi:hypothetical protein
MTWCLTASNVDVDVDLLFQENSTIKQKMCVLASAFRILSYSIDMLLIFFAQMQIIFISYFSSALTEKIVSALKRMKCPHRLEPYQIQGLDFIHIYPVVQVCGVQFPWF